MPIAVSASVPEQTSTRLTFVTGKGGVGKTTVATGIACWAAANGERTLAVDVVASGQLRAAVEATGAGSDSGVGPTVLDLTTEASIDEYVKLFLKVPIAPSSLPILAGIFDFVSTAAPAVKEILTVGKIGYEAVHGSWDRIVVDGPATGHIIELLTAPDDLRRLAPSGPLANQTGWLSDALVSETTDIVVVAQAEELIVSETSELLERIQSDTDVSIGAVVNNRLYPGLSDAALAEATTLSQKTGPLGAVASLLVGDLDQKVEQAGQLDELAESVGVPCIAVNERPMDPVAQVGDSIRASQWR